ncbi:MAG: DUF5996 family protein, partial [Schleiferiaceae bacterium]|nr:DUF5996 family protein [Schleiferiaceae bacterium]
MKGDEDFGDLSIPYSRIKLKQMKTNNLWPDLQFSEYKDTLETLHHWLQIVGKIRLRTMPWQNHSWHATLYITAKGYSTQAIPYEGRIIQFDFDFIEHKLFITCSNAGQATIDLKARTVADFYQELREKLVELGINVKIHASPNEVDPAIPFSQNTTNKSYHPETAYSMWKAMMKVNEVFQKFRSGFTGKVSPVHLFWGAFDLAVTRFSGKDAPLHPGGMPNMPLEVMQEAYSKEVSSAGFWLGSNDSPLPVFYAYAYPSAESFGQQSVKPESAFWSPEMGE